MTASLLSTALLLAAAAAGAPQLPEKLDIEIELQTPIDEKATPANSEIAFKLIRDLKKDNAVLAPKGALGTARVTRFQKHSAVIRNVKRNYYMVGVRLLTLTTGEGAVPLGTNLETIRPTATNDYFIPYSHGPDRWGEFEQYRSLFTAPPPEPGESFIGVVREYLKIPKGLRMVFRTTGG